jgi:ParB/RepB/Spo0J family partition protein
MEKTSRTKVHKKKEAVVKTNQTQKPEKTVMIPVEKLLKPDDYFRKNGLDAEAEKMLFKKIKIMAENMKEHGQLHPIIVRKEGDKFRICTGHLRNLACRMNKWPEVKAVVKDLSDDEVHELNVAENMCRVDLTSVQREHMVFSLWETGRYDNYAILGRRIGLSGERVSNLLSAKEIRDKIPEGTNPGLVSTKTLIALKPLKVQEQRKIVKLMEKGFLKPSEVAEAVKNISGWSKGAKEAILDGNYPYNKAVVRINDHLKQFDHWKSEIEKRLDNKVAFNKSLKSELPEEKIKLFRAFFKAIKQIEPEMITSLDKVEASWEIKYTKFSACLFIRLLHRLEVITEEQYAEILGMLGEKPKSVEGLKEDGGERFFMGEQGWENRPKSLVALDKVKLDSPETVIAEKQEDVEKANNINDVKAHKTKGN